MIRIITPVELSSFSERKDKSVRLTVITNELTDEEFIAVRRMQSVPGFMCLQTEEVKSDLTDVMDELDVDLYDTPKSPSQRLRNVLYKFYEQEADEVTDEGFKLFYKQKLETIIQHFKDKLHD